MHKPRNYIFLLNNTFKNKILVLIIELNLVYWLVHIHFHYFKTD